jgi:hypothetical protein
MALAGRRFGCGRGVSGQRLSLSWHHTRSFWQRSRVECEQSCDSFARRTVCSAAGTPETRRSMPRSRFLIAGLGSVRQHVASSKGG